MFSPGIFPTWSLVLGKVWKSKLEDEDQQRLAFEGTWLEEGNTLQYYSIQENSALDLMLRMYG